jgi:hypothetical protein
MRSSFSLGQAVNTYEFAKTRGKIITAPQAAVAGEVSFSESL